MRKTKAQADYHRQMAEINKDRALAKDRPKQSKTSFRDTKLYYYGVRILIIIAVLYLVSIFDSAIYNIINMYR